MSYSISTLLTRNLHDVFGENDPTRRRAAIDEIFTEDCVFHEPKGVYHGREEIDRVAGKIKATHPDFRYQVIAGPEELGKGGQVRWASGRPGEAPAYAGTDFIIAHGGRIAAVYPSFTWLRRELPVARSRPSALNRVLARIEAALTQCYGRVSGPSGAATKLGLPARTLDSKIKRFKISKYKFKIPPRWLSRFHRFAAKHLVKTGRTVVRLDLVL